MQLPPNNPHLVVPTDGFLDPDATNGLRARSAGSAVSRYQTERDLDNNPVTCATDLLTDLLHFLHSQNQNPSKPSTKPASTSSTKHKPTNKKQNPTSASLCDLCAFALKSFSI